MKIPAKETALVVIDMQTILFDPEPPEAEPVVTRINGLASRAREAGVPVVWVQHETSGGDLVADTPGWQLHPGLVTARSHGYGRLSRTLHQVPAPWRHGLVTAVAFCFDGAPAHQKA